MTSPSNPTYRVTRTPTFKPRTSDPLQLVFYPPVLETDPVLSGTPVVGEVLTVTSGTWDSPPWTPTYWYEWMRDGTVFSPHYPNNYRLRDADLGHSISVKVTATNRDGSAVATSNSLGPVTA